MASASTPQPACSVPACLVRLPAGLYHLTFTASNGVGSNATQSFTLTISMSPNRPMSPRSISTSLQRPVDAVGLSACERQARGGNAPCGSDRALVHSTEYYDMIMQQAYQRYLGRRRRRRSAGCLDHADAKRGQRRATGGGIPGLARGLRSRRSTRRCLGSTRCTWTCSAARSMPRERAAGPASSPSASAAHW